MSPEQIDKKGKDKERDIPDNIDVVAPPSVSSDTDRLNKLEFPQISFKFKDPNSIFSKTLGVVLLRLIAQTESVPLELSDLVVTDSLQISVSLLEDGYNVLQIISENNIGADNFDPPGLQLLANPKYKGRYLTASSLELVDILSAVSNASIRDKSLQPSTEIKNENLEELLVLSPIRDKRILVVDNSQLNRLSARFQLGKHNTVDICETYKEGAALLKSKSYDLVLLDLLMPAESFTLSSTAYSYVAGSEFPAGIFLALIAARSGAKEIAVITDASHHDHPATALLDYVGWGNLIEVEGQTKLSFQAANMKKIANTNERFKDWSKIKLFSE